MGLVGSEMCIRDRYTISTTINAQEALDLVVQTGSSNETYIDVSGNLAWPEGRRVAACNIQNIGCDVDENGQGITVRHGELIDMLAFNVVDTTELRTRIGIQPRASASAAFSDLQMGVFGAIFLYLLAAAILIETGMSTLFNWRWWIVFAEGRGLKTVAMVGVSYLFISSTGFDFFNMLLRAVGDDRAPATDPFGKFISTLILAGGSGTIFRLASIFGIRTPYDNQQAALAARVAAKLKLKLKISDDVDLARGITFFVDDRAVGSVNKKAAGAFSDFSTKIDPGEHKLTAKAYRKQSNSQFETDIFSFVAMADKTTSLQMEIQPN